MGLSSHTPMSKTHEIWLSQASGSSATHSHTRLFQIQYCLLGSSLFGPCSYISFVRLRVWRVLRSSYTNLLVCYSTSLGKGRDDLITNNVQNQNTTRIIKLKQRASLQLVMLHFRSCSTMTNLSYHLLKAPVRCLILISLRRLSFNACS